MQGTRATLAAAAALASAEAAVTLLRPREQIPAPVAVQATSYFSPQEIGRARRFGRPQLAIGLASTALETALLARLVARPPRALLGPVRRPVGAAALTGAALSAGLGVATLPLAALARHRARRVGLITQGWGGWAADLAKSAAIGGAVAAAGAGGAVALMRRSPRGWWLPGAGLATAAGALFAAAGPVVLDPIFNRFTPLAPGQARDDVLALAGAAGVRVGEVFAVDASRRTTAANAYVTGLGATKRVVLFDTLIDDFSLDQVRSVVAHELGHVKHRDVPRGLLWLAIVAIPGTLVIQRLTERLAPEARDRSAGPAVLLPAALSITVVAFVLNIAGNALSRRVEASADGFSLKLTANPAAFIQMQRKISLENIDDPDPPGWEQFLFGTHPTTDQRIGAALAWARKQ